MSQPPTLSIVTISWNQMDDIIEYLSAMEKTKRECRYPIEMVLVDNGSVDGTPEMIERDYPWVKLVRNRKNEGFAAGCNAGLHAATGDYLMLLNPDAHANARALNGMMRFLEKHPKVGGVGCQLLHEDGLPQRSAYGETSVISYIKNHSIIYPLFEHIQKQLHKAGLFRRTRPFECAWMQAACLIVPRHVYEKVGDMEASFFIYCEDTDWCHRIRKAGYKMVHMPNLQMHHKQKGSVGKRPEFFFRRVYRSILHYWNRQFTGAKRERLIRTMQLDMQLRKPVYRAVMFLRPGTRPKYTERLRSVDRMIDILHARDPDLFDDPPPR